MSHFLWNVSVQHTEPYFLVAMQYTPGCLTAWECLCPAWSDTMVTGPLRLRPVYRVELQSDGSVGCYCLTGCDNSDGHQCVILKVWLTFTLVALFYIPLF